MKMRVGDSDALRDKQYRQEIFVQLLYARYRRSKGSPFWCYKTPSVASSTSGTRV